MQTRPFITEVTVSSPCGSVVGSSRQLQVVDLDHARPATRVNTETNSSAGNATRNEDRRVGRGNPV